MKDKEGSNMTLEGVSERGKGRVREKGGKRGWVGGGLARKEFLMRK